MTVNELKIFKYMQLLNDSAKRQRQWLLWTGILILSQVPSCGSRAVIIALGLRHPSPSKSWSWQVQMAGSQRIALGQSTSEPQVALKGRAVNIARVGRLLAAQMTTSGQSPRAKEKRLSNTSPAPCSLKQRHKQVTGRSIHGRNRFAFSREGRQLSKTTMRRL